MSTAVEDLLDAAAAAAHVGCSPRTIHYRAARKGLPRVRVGGGVFFTAEDLDFHFKALPLDPRKRPGSRG